MLTAKIEMSSYSLQGDVSLTHVANLRLQLRSLNALRKHQNDSCLQTLLQRVKNYCLSIAVGMIVSTWKDGINFANKIGQEMRSTSTGVSSSAALIVTADWAIEYPQPMPPRVHVSIPS